MSKERPRLEVEGSTLKLILTNKILSDLKSGEYSILISEDGGALGFQKLNLTDFSRSTAITQAAASKASGSQPSQEGSSKEAGKIKPGKSRKGKTPKGVAPSHDDAVQSRLRRIGRFAPDLTLQENLDSLDKELRSAVTSKSKDFKEYALAKELPGYETAVLARKTQVLQPRVDRKVTAGNSPSTPEGVATREGGPCVRRSSEKEELADETQVSMAEEEGKEEKIPEVQGTGEGQQSEEMGETSCEGTPFTTVVRPRQGRRSYAQASISSLGEALRAASRNSQGDPGNSSTILSSHEERTGRGGGRQGGRFGRKTRSFS